MNNTFSNSFSRFTALLKKQNSLTVRNFILTNSLQKVLEVAIVSSVVVLIIATQLFKLPSIGLIVGIFAIAVYRVLPGIIKGINRILYIIDDENAIHFNPFFKVCVCFGEQAKKTKK